MTGVTPIKSFTEATREIPIVTEPAVLVVGGGPAGIAASISASRLGVNVLLVERYGFLGGWATAALVGPLMSYHTRKKGIVKKGTTPDRSSVEDKTGYEKVISGFLDEFVTELLVKEGALGPKADYGYMVPFDPEIFKRVAQELIERAGVDLILHSLFVDSIVENGWVKGAVLEGKTGRIGVKAGVVVDATGDGDVAARSGAPFKIGRAEDGHTQPATLMFRLAGVNSETFLRYKRANPDQFKGEAGLYDLIKEATRRGDLKLTRENILFFKLPRRGEVVVNSTRVFDVNGISVWDLTRAELEARKQAFMLLQFFKKYVPGFEKSYIVETAPQIGIRETRRIIGDYILHDEDILFDNKFDDVIARGAYPIDIHNPDGKGTIMVPLEAGSSYDIPYRCLLPKGINNLLTAGRCISGTHEAQSSFRVIPISMATGQAAGVAAALASVNNCSPRDVPTATVQKALLEQKANLGRSVRQKLQV